MKILKWLSGLLCSFSLIFIVLVSSFELAVYSDMGFYEKEYEKYQVLSDVRMEMTDVLYVSEEMIGYLRGDREDLVVNTVVDGQQKEFFNQREKDHMLDVRNIFLMGLAARRIALIVCFFSALLLILLQSDWKWFLPGVFLLASGIFALAAAVIGALFAVNFSKYFVIFHEIFFSNDLWILDPATDLMINILPEGFFMDMLIRVGVFFVGIMAILLIAAAGWRIWQKRKAEDLLAS